jgi:CheY-like chemotaxis protein
MHDIAIKLVKLIPSVFWFCLAAALVVLFYRPILNELLPNLTDFEVLGVGFSFVKYSMDAAIELAEKFPQWKIEISATDKKLALNRVEKHLKIFKGAKFIWVDDNPENNLNELKMFRHLKVEIDTAKDTEQALEMLRRMNYDLVISDMSRGDKMTEGLEFLERFRKEDGTTPVIFYIGIIDPQKGTPLQAFGITNRPDELLHLTLDVLERKRY